MIIKNVQVFREDKSFVPGTIVLKDGLIEEIRDVVTEEMKEDGGDCQGGLGAVAACHCQEEVIDGGGCYAIPGLIDLHFHGCMGHDFCDETREAFEEIAKYEASIGVTAIAPATMTLPVEELEHILSEAADFRNTQPADGADLIGVNMEGPFISAAKKGAQDDRNIIPCDAAVCERFLKASDGLVKYMGLAPEEGDAVSFINQVKDKVSVALAHTNADYETAKAAFDAGACHAVHLYNAMPAYTHRAPGVIGAVADSEHVMAELICDGVHIHPAVVRTTFKMLGEDRMILISDSMRATGMQDGQYTLGGLDVKVVGNRATLVSDGSLAGSATTLPDCMRVAVKDMEIPLETAVACATMNPAKSLGVYDKYGSLTPGKKGNIVLLDKDLNLKAVIKDGKQLK